MTTIIVGCSKSKVETDDAVEARNLYESPYFNKRYTLAEQQDGDVYILSAKYGILEPSDEIEPYNVSMRDLTADERRAMVDEIDCSKFDDEIVVYAGTLYTNVVRDACDDATVTKPLSGGIGEQMSQLNSMITE